MMDIKVPEIGTRVEVTTHFSLEWMNEYKKPTVGIVAHSHPWEKPGTFRLIGTNTWLGESTIDLAYVTSIKILGTSRDPENPAAALNEPSTGQEKPQSFEIKGSKDNVYIVTLDGEKSSCTCPAGTHGRLCKHVKAARELAAG